MFIIGSAYSIIWKYKFEAILEVNAYIDLAVFFYSDHHVHDGSLQKILILLGKLVGFQFDDVQDPAASGF